MNHDGWTHELCAECFHAFGTDDAPEERADGVCCACGHPRETAEHRLSPAQCRRRLIMPSAQAETAYLPPVEPVVPHPEAASSFEFMSSGPPEDLGGTKGGGD